MVIPTEMNPLASMQPMSNMPSTNAAPGTVGFDFNTYLLGLQDKASSVDGTLDWQSLIKSDDLVPTDLLGDQSKGQEVTTQDPLAALFAVPQSTNPVIAAPIAPATPAAVPVATAEIGLPQAKQQQPIAPAKSTESLQSEPKIQTVDWKALGLTQATPESIQSQGWDVQQVERLFAERQVDMPQSESGKLALPVDAKVLSVQSQPEKVQAFQQQPLTAHQPIIQMSEVQRKAETSVPASGMRAEVAPETVVKEGPAAKVELKNRVKPETNANSDYSLLSSIAGDSGNPPVKAETAVTASAQILEATAPKDAGKPQWVSSAETMASQGGGKMTIALSPPELGKVEIEVITRGKNVSVEMRSESEGAKKILQGGMSDLKSALMGHDLVLQRSEVKVATLERSSFDGFNSQQSFQNDHANPNRQQGFGNPSNGQSERNARWELAQSSTNPVRQMASRSYAPTGVVGRVDVRI
jgi:flagellar hook-length control protein FliK